MSNQNHANIQADQLSGGAIRITHGSPVQEAEFIPGPQSRVYGGTTRFNAGHDTEARTEKVTRYQVDHEGHVGGSILATLRQEGPHKTVETVPGQPASRTLVQAAIREGLLSRDAAGRLADVQANGQQRTLETAQAEKAAVDEAEKAAEQAAHEEAMKGVFSAHEDQDFAADMAEVPEEAFRPTMAAAIADLAMGRDGFDSAIRRLTESPGMEPTFAETKVLQAVSYFQSIADRAAMKAGVTAENLPAFHEFLRNNPNRLMSALNALTLARDVGPLQQQAREWVMRKQGA